MEKHVSVPSRRKDSEVNLSVSISSLDRLTDRPTHRPNEFWVGPLWNVFLSGEYTGNFESEKNNTKMEEK